MAAHDLFIWNQQVQQRLPNGVWQILVNPGLVPPSFQIQVSWTEVGQPAPVQHQMVIQVPGF